MLFSTQGNTSLVWAAVDRLRVDLQKQYRLQRVAAFHAYSDPGHDLLILYKLIPQAPATQK